MKEDRVDEFIKNPKKALFTLALPIVIAMVVQVMYNIVDTAFVGRLGAEAIAALTFSFPLFFILIAVNSGVGAGMSSRISRYLGAKNKEAAENTAMHGLFISLLLAAVVFVIGLITLGPFFTLLGATDTVLEMAMDYMIIILIGVFFMFPSFVVNSIFSAQGDTKTPMKVHIFALVLNIILDPIFIYVLGYGIKGAAMATVISFSAALLVYVYYLKKKSHLKIGLKSFKFSFPIIRDIFKVGAPATLMMLLLSVYMMFINRFMAHFGVNYVAAFGIASRLESVAVMPLVAFSMALMTLVGMFFGAKRHDLVKSIIKYGMKMAIIFTSSIGIIFFIFPSLFLRIFTPDAALLSLGSAYLRIDVFTFPLMAIGMTVSRSMQAMGYGLPGLVINVARILVVAVPLAYIFVFVLGLSYLSIAVAMVIGAVIASIIALIWIRIEFKKLEKKS
jgi:putative MATE family efflux protein